MRYRITQAQPGTKLWRHIERYSPQTVRYIADPNDRGDYRCFIALAARSSFAGLCIVDIGRLGFGPLADQSVACLENIFVPAQYRRHGIGTALLQKAFDVAWQEQAAHVWWTVEYEEVGAIAFYASRGAVFIAEEDPASDTPEKYYTVVVASPGAVARSHSATPGSPA